MRVRYVAALSLIFTYLFLFEYLPPFRWVDIPHDLEYYHYPLDDLVFQRLSQGHIPEWDPTMYCGMSLIGNSQTAMFYPPMWAVFLANAGQPRLKYRSLEIMVIGHVWLAFLFAFIWLRNRGLRDLACVLGAGIFAYSGYMLLQLQHLGLVCAYAWLPLAFWGIDQATARRAWRPLWKVVLAASFSILAGHPPAALVCFACMLTYAAFGPMRWKSLAGVSAALLLSISIAMVQLLPTWEATAFREAHEGYGAGIRDPKFYLSYLVPNFFDFGLHTSAWANPGYEYLYLGAAAFFGLLCLRRRVLPLLGVGLMSVIMVTNPFGLVWAVIQHSEMLSQVCRSWYFLAGITAAVAGLAAYGLDDFLGRAPRSMPRWAAPILLASLCAWAAWLMWMWHPGGPGFAIGWRSATDAAVMFALFCAAMFVIRNEKRKVLVAALLIAVGIDYKVFGTSKRFNANEGKIDHLLAYAGFPGMHDETYRKLVQDPGYRVALDRDNPTPTDLRHYGLATPQGGDPLAPAQYHQVLAPVGAYYGPLEIDPANQDLLRMLGVRYYITSEEQPRFKQLAAERDFRQLQPFDGYFKVFEFLKARPQYYWEAEGPDDTISRTFWSAERREFAVHSSTGGRFILVEQFFPGWQATVDDWAVPIERWRAAFQAVPVAAGEHRLRFEFRSSGLRVGAGISAVTLAILPCFWIGWKRRSKTSS